MTRRRALTIIEKMALSDEIMAAAAAAVDPIMGRYEAQQVDGFGVMRAVASGLSRLMAVYAASAIMTDEDFDAFLGVVRADIEVALADLGLEAATVAPETRH